MPPVHAARVRGEHLDERLARACRLAFKHVEARCELGELRLGSRVEDDGQVYPQQQRARARSVSTRRIWVC